MLVILLSAYKNKGNIMSGDKPKTVRKALAAGFYGDLAMVGSEKTAAMDAQQLEKLHINFPINTVVPSLLNPRRRTLDRAGVTPDSVAELAIKEFESKADWLARMDGHIASITDPKSQLIWLNLVDLAVSILEQGILQPVIVNKDHVIVAGERRWTASQLAGKKHLRVIVRLFSSVEEAIFRLTENLRRSDLSVAETVSGLRSVVAISLGSCEPENNRITIDEVSAITGAGRTTSAYYRAFCRLPDGDPVLNAILDDQYSSVRLAYIDAAERVRVLLSSNTKEPLLAPAEEPIEGGEESPKKTGNDKAEFTKAKIKVPMRPSVSRLIDVFASLDGLPEKIAGELIAISKQWNAVDDKEKAKLLASAMDMTIEFLETKQ